MKRLLIILFLPLVCLGDFGTLEDFTTFTEVDADASITVAENTITLSTMQSRNFEYKVYYDYGVNNFNGDLAHRVKINMSGTNVGWCNPWYISNSTNDVYDAEQANEDYQSVLFYNNNGSPQIYLRIAENGSITQDSVNVSASTDYYLTVERDDDAGANNTGQLTLRVYTGNYYQESGASEVGTVTVDCSVGEQNDFRYLFVVNSYDNNLGTDAISGTVKDLDLGEAAPPTDGGMGTIMSIMLD